METQTSDMMDHESGRISNSGVSGETNKIDNNSSQEAFNSQGIKFNGWGFKVDRLFEVAYRFYKRNESKAFQPSFDVRNQMNALILQARYGNFDDGKAPDIGFLDLVGKSRRNQWATLKGMSKTEAMSTFICTLDEICPLFKAYAEAVKISSSSQAPTVKDIDVSKQNELAPSISSESDEQLKAIHTSLCRQTYSQFKSYAEKQYPDDQPKQKYLITTLQEQYYQQYISQLNLDLGDKNESQSNGDDNSSNSVQSVQISKPQPIPAIVPNSGSNIANGSTTDPPTEEVQLDESNLVTKHEREEYIGESRSDYEPTVLNRSHILVQEVGNNLNNNLADSMLSTLDTNAPSLEPHDSSLNSQPNLLNKPVGQLENLPPQVQMATERWTRNENGPHSSTPPAVYHASNSPLISKFEPYPEPKPISSNQRQQSNFPNTMKDSNQNLDHHKQSEETSRYTAPYVAPIIEPTSPAELNHGYNYSSPNLAAPTNIPNLETINSLTDQQLVGQEPSYSHHQQPLPVVDTWSCGSSSGASSPLQRSISYEPLELATIWTKKGVSEFKDSLIDDKHGGAYMVKQGTLLTIQVPTYPDGRYIYWEFATDDYDIGFGLDFVYDTNLVEPLALKFNEETDEDEEEDIDNLNELECLNEVNPDIESVSEVEKSNGIKRRLGDIEKRRAEKNKRLANTVSIVPTYRRDSHEEIFVGRHRYPGIGYYSLKFDNTYSVLRSKSLYFRICYFI